MKSRLYVGSVMHARLEPVKHAFTYPLFSFAIDLAELEEIGRDLRLFGHNRFRPFSLRDRDYLAGAGAIREKLLRYLAETGGRARVERVLLVTMPRFFGYAFNPVSFYYCYDPDGALATCAAEVNNTFGERHLYLLGAPARGEAGAAEFRADKAFHVSPFNDRQGAYQFLLREPDDTLEIRVDLERDGRTLLKTALTGRARPLTDAQLLRILLRMPLAAWKTVPRIDWQAARLYFGKKLPVHSRPPPASAMTIGRRRPTPAQRLGRRAFFATLARLERGALEVELPDGSLRRFGETEAAPATMRVLDDRLFSRVLLGGSVGLGEAFTAGEWTSTNLPGVLGLFAANLERLRRGGRTAASAGWVANRIERLARANSLAGSRRNIEAHYDLGNEFYRLFLDPTLTYSCALFRDPAESLEQGQRNKLHSIIDKARIGPRDHVLEIGCGWGGFALEAARRTGCRVTGITISPKQLAAARDRARAAGLEARVDFQLCDYRHAQGRYDKIVSIEMLEAVGKDYFPAFFAASDRLLAPDGLAVLQVITIPDDRYRVYCNSVDWIQKHIFPGGHLPSLGALVDAMGKASRLTLEHAENIGLHYARTLAEWRAAFLANWPQIAALGFDERFRRTWVYYFSYCEAGFATRLINVLQLVLTRSQSERSEFLPGGPHLGQGNAGRVGGHREPGRAAPPVGGPCALRLGVEPAPGQLGEDLPQALARASGEGPGSGEDIIVERHGRPHGSDTLIR